MAGIQVLPSLDRFAGLRQGSQNFVQQFLQRKQQEAGLADQQQIMQFIQQRQQGQQPGTPQFQTQQGAAAFNNFIGQQQENVALGPGQGLFNRATGQQVGQSQPVAATSKQTSSVIEDPNDPTKAIRVRNTFNANGELVNQVKIGDATLAEKIGGVAAEGLSRGSKSKLETELVSLEETQAELGIINEQIDEDFFVNIDLSNPLGNSKASAFITAQAEKFGVEPSKARGAFLSKKTKFFADSKRVFLKFRKFITGVAGGLPEFREIAKASIDPENDSVTEFRAKMESMRDSAVRLQTIMTRVRSKGFAPSKANIAAEIKNAGGLDKIPLPNSAVPNGGGGVGLPTLDQVRSGLQQNVSPMSAVNPKTGARIQSTDGGKTWQPVQ